MTKVSPVAGTPATSVDQVIDRIVQREKEVVETMKKVQPMVETYVQNTRPDAELGSVPMSDEYYLGRVTLSRTLDEKFYTEGQEKVGWKASMVGVMDPLVMRNFYRTKLVPTGFASMILPDARGLDRNVYDYQFIAAGISGRCPLPAVPGGAQERIGHGRFLGRIWVEDQDYNIVRFNGSFVNPARSGIFMHMDSWRQNVQARSVAALAKFTCEEDSVKGHRGRIKAQTRLWGYDVQLGTAGGVYPDAGRSGFPECG